MRKFKTQIILVSGQQIPNVTPVMDPAIRPGKVILCTSNKMQGTADTLCRYFKSKNIEAEIFPLGDAYEFSELKEKFLELACNLENIKDDLAVNLTGGTKLMTIAAQMAFMDNGFHCFYVIPENDSIVMLTGDSGKYDIQERMLLEDFFAIHGYTVRNIKRNMLISDAEQKLFSDLLAGYDKFKYPLKELNFLATLAEDEELLYISNDIHEKSYELLQLFQNAGAIKYYDDRKIWFASEKMRDFCKGIWLEDYTYLILSQLKSEFKFQDFACSIEIVSSSGVKNEIDAAVLVNNALYIIECKTARLSEKGADVLYKIDTLKDFAGMLTKTAVVSFNPLETYDRTRANDLKIKLIEGQALKNLDEHLKAFCRIQ